MSKILQQKAQEIEAKRKGAEKFYNETDEQVQKGEALSTDQKTFIIDLNKTIEDLEEQYKELEARELGREANEQRLKDLNRPERKRSDYAGNGDDPIAQQAKTIADALLSDEAFKAWQKEICKYGSAVQTAKFGQSPAVMLEQSIKTLVTGLSSTSGGALVVNDRKPIVDMFYQRPLTVRDLITLGETESDTVEFVQVTSVTNNADPTAEATGTGDGTGNKPESGMDLAIKTVPVETIAHWVPATRRALADASQLRTTIDNFLRYGIDEELEDQIMGGSGTSPNLTGVYNTSGIQTQSYATDILTTLRKARTKLRTVGRCVPTAWVMHPNDWETIDLLKDNEARYIYGGPAVLGNPRVWGLPVVESEAATEGLPVGADWKLATLWDRMQTAIYVSDSHGDFFVRNIIAILAEMRAAFGLIRPQAFITVDITA